MEITLKEIESVFDKLVNNELTREDASNWADKLMYALDDWNLVFEPADDKEIIWDAIGFLQGIDVKDTPNSYLFVIKDIEDYVQKIGNYSAKKGNNEK